MYLKDLNWCVQTTRRAGEIKKEAVGTYTMNFQTSLSATKNDSTGTHFAKSTTYLFKNKNVWCYQIKNGHHILGLSHLAS